MFDKPIWMQKLKDLLDDDWNIFVLNQCFCVGIPVET